MRFRQTSEAVGTLLLVLLAFGASAFAGATPQTIISGSTALSVSDASTVATTSNSCCISTWGPINGHYWTFYTSSSSSSGVGPWWFTTCPAAACVWSSPTKIPSSGSVWSSAWVSGITVYYVSSSNQFNDPSFYFMTGTLKNDSSITWGREQKVGVADQLGNQCFYVRGIYPSVDTNGNVWVSLQCKVALTNYNFDVYSYSSLTRLWTLRHSDTTGNSSEVGYTVPLTAGKVALLYEVTVPLVNPSSSSVIIWDGTGSWLGPYTVPTIIDRASAIHIGDTLQLCSVDGSSPPNLVLWTFGYGSGSWSGPVLVSNGIQGGRGRNCAITTDGTTSVIIYSIEASSTYAALSTDNGLTWTPLTVIDSGLVLSIRQTLPPTFSGSFTGVWYSGKSNPFTLRYAIFSIGISATTTSTTLSSSSATSTTTQTTTLPTTSCCIARAINRRRFRRCFAVMKSASAGCWPPRGNSMRRCGSTSSATTAWPTATRCSISRRTSNHCRCELGKDYAVVYDSTMARFWFFNDRARRTVTETLRTIPDGRYCARRGTGAIALPVSGSLFRRADFPDARRRADCAQPHGRTAHSRDAWLSPGREAQLRRAADQSARRSCAFLPDDNHAWPEWAARPCGWAPATRLRAAGKSVRQIAIRNRAMQPLQFRVAAQRRLRGSRAASHFSCGARAH